MTPVIQLTGINKAYQVGPIEVAALRDLSLTVAPGEFLVISGPSGSGKSTLLNLLGLLDRADAGVYRLDGRDVAGIGDDECTLLRNRKLGFIFQAAPMLPRLNAEGNVALPLHYRGVRPSEALAQARAAIARVGLAAWSQHLPEQLSGGQLQRVAIARAIVGKPMLILADEPTAALDKAAAQDVITLLDEINRDTGATIIMITHDHADHARASRHLVLDGGQLHAPVATS